VVDGLKNCHLSKKEKKKLLSSI